jgi:hypothetical protein
MISLYERHMICLKFKFKIKFIYVFRYIINLYIYFVKNKKSIVSRYYDTILRYDTADKETILPSIPILKTLLTGEEEGRRQHIHVRKDRE